MSVNFHCKFLARNLFLLQERKMHLRERRKRKVYLKEYTNLQRKNKATATTTTKIHRVFLKTQHPSQAPGGSKPLNMQLHSFSHHSLSLLFFRSSLPEYCPSTYFSFVIGLRSPLINHPGSS